MDLDTAPTEQQTMQMKIIRSVARSLVMAIVNNTPACEEQEIAVSKVREAAVAAYAAIILEK